jgi:hypothetical protein
MIREKKLTLEMFMKQVASSTLISSTVLIEVLAQITISLMNPHASKG